MKIIIYIQYYKMGERIRVRSKHKNIRRKNIRRKNTMRKNTKRKNTMRKNIMRKNTRRNNTRRNNTSRKNTRRRTYCGGMPTPGQAQEQCSNAAAEEETRQIVMSVDAEDAGDEMVPPPRGVEFIGLRNSSGLSSEERRVMRDEMLNQMHLKRTKQFLDARQDVIEKYGDHGLNLLKSAIDGTNDKPLKTLLDDKESMKAFVISMMRSITANSDEARNDNHRLREDISALEEKFDHVIKSKLALREDISALEEKFDHVIKSKLANLIPNISCRRRS